ncbi:MAG: TolC family protein [Candidatus Gastranaerophilales bacterium]|nr:TolC family protein [Candidatus Gastranaerophilales bacterium]
MKIIWIIFILLFVQNIAMAAVSEYIEAYSQCCENESYKKFEQVIKGSASISDIEKQFVIDREIENELGSHFIYTDLENCIKIALGENYDIKINRADADEAYWINKNAQFQLLPDIYYNYDIKNLEGNYLVGGIVATTTHEVPIQSYFIAEWSTINQGKYFFYLAQTRNLLKSAKATLEYTKDETLLNTITNYYDTLARKLEIEVQKVNLYDRLEQLRYTQARFESGLGTLYDVKRAQAELAGAQQDYTAALNSLRLQQASLANVLGVDVLEAVYPFEIAVDKRQLVNPSYSIEELYEQALESREDIKAKKAEINAYRAQRSSNYTDIIPAVTISYQNGMVGTKRMGMSSHNSITLDVRANLGKNMLMGTITQIKADSAVVRAKKLELIKLERQVKEDIINSYYDSLNALKKIEASEVEVEAADTSLNLSLANMKAGEATFIDVIASQNIKVQANLNLIKNMIEYNKAQSKLLFDMGIISPKNVLKDYKTRFY